MASFSQLCSQSTDGGRISIESEDPVQVSRVEREYSLEIFAGKGQSDIQLKASKYEHRTDFNSANWDSSHGRGVNYKVGYECPV